jgi:hypothetical protein
MFRIVSSWFSTLSRTFTAIAVRRCLSVTLIGLLGFAGSAVVGFMSNIPQPAVHDEFSYLLAADTFAHGRLTNPTHPLWVHFESFHIIHQPTYMSKYPPAQGLVLAVGQVMGGHPIVGVWLSFGLMCAAICWMLYAWVPPRWAVLGGILALTNPMLGIAGYWAQSYWGGAVAATGGALVLGGVRRLVREPRVLHSLLTGVGLAILANSRPYEGLLVSLPAGIVLFVSLVGKRGSVLRAAVGQMVLPLLIIISLTATAMGFYNLRVTGNMFLMPYQVYENTYEIAPVFLWQTPQAEPIYRHQVLRDFHTQVGLSRYNRQRSVAGFITEKLTSFALILFFYSGFVLAIPLLRMFSVMVPWAMRDRWALFVLLTNGVLFSGLLAATYVKTHYSAPVYGINFVFVLQALRLWRKRDKVMGQFRSQLIPFLGIVFLVWWLCGPFTQAKSASWYQQRAIILRQLKGSEGDHLILVKYSPEHSVHQEWVYNEADIDAAKVVWARWMDNDQNCKLVEYFKDRNIWSLEIDSSPSIPGLTPHPKNLCR